MEEIQLIKEEKPEIINTYIPKTDTVINNSLIESKIPYLEIDDYGNEKVLYRKETKLIVEIEKERAELEEQIVKLQEKIREIDVRLELKPAQVEEPIEITKEK